MGNEKHIEWLLAGQATWNTKRGTHDFRPDFWGVNFFEIFEEAEKLDPNGKVLLSGFNLSNAVFHGANLNKVNFIQSNLRGARLEGAWFPDTSFSGSDLTGAKFGICGLSNVDLTSAVLKCTDLVEANLSGTNLGWSRFWQARLFSSFRNLEESTSHSGTPIEIKNVAELIEICFEIRERYEGYTLYFRGEHDCTWDLRPSVMRPSADGTFKLRTHEGEMLRDLIARSPADFTGMTSALEQMVIAQHHGLKTRLLDVSHNPCIALFSACGAPGPSGESHDKETAGRLHVFAVPKELIKPFDSDTVSTVCNFAKLDRSYQNLLLGKTGEDSHKEDTPIQYLYSEAMRHLYHYIQQEKPHFEERIDPRDFFHVFVAEPKQSFQRIRAQRGAFIISAFHERFEKDEIQSQIRDVPVYEHETLMVPCKKKGSILEELNLLDFTRETLYPSLDEVANRITSSYM